MTEPPDRTVDERISALPLEAKVGQLFHVGIPGTSVTDAARELIADYGVGGVVYFDRNVETPTQFARLSAALQETATEALGIPLLLSVDQEGGRVARLPFGTTPPGAMAVGATDDPELARALGAGIGRQLRAVGVTMNFAPVLDINVNPDNPVIGPRSFGDDPERVATLGRAVTTGMQDAGVAACGKHFPGHGDTERDSHEALPVLTADRERLDGTELVPFRRAINAGIDAIMTAHVAVPSVTSDRDLPATLSPVVLTDLLREELGYDGLVITDCMEMAGVADTTGTVAGAVAAIRAGADQVLVSHSPSLAMDSIDAVVQAVRGGDLSEERINGAVGRVLAMKAGTTPFDQSAPVDDQAFQAVVDASERVARRAVTVVRDDANLLPLDTDEVVVWDPRGSEHSMTVRDTFCDALSTQDRAVRTATGPPSELQVSETEVVVATTTNAKSDEAQRAALATVLDRHPRVVVVAASNPYDLGAIDTAPTALTTYDATPELLATASEVLVGERVATGSLPISLDTDTD